MSYTVFIRENTTGEIRPCSVPWDWYKNGDHGDLYWWQKGNMSCDCNRELYFLRANNEPEPEETQCGHTRFTVIKAVLPSGKEIEIDESAEEPKASTKGDHE